MTSALDSTENWQQSNFPGLGLLPGAQGRWSAQISVQVGSTFSLPVVGCISLLLVHQESLGDARFTGDCAPFLREIRGSRDAV